MGCTFLDLFAWTCLIIMISVTAGIFYGLFGEYFPMCKDQKQGRNAKLKKEKEKAKLDKLRADPIEKAKRAQNTDASAAWR